MSHDVLELVLGRAPARSMCCSRWRQARVRAEIARLNRRVGGRAAGMAADFGSPWRAGLFLDMVELGCRHGVVAGSAALYLELEPPLGWRPDDVDCWVDGRDIGHEAVVAALDAGGDPQVQTYSQGRIETVEYDRSIPVMLQPGYRGNLVGDVIQASYPGDSSVVEVTVRGQRFQVISQDVSCGRHLAGGPVECGCAAGEACRRCLGTVEAPAIIQEDNGPHPATYTLEWPRGLPHTRFDLGLVCVDARSDGDSVNVTRRAGRPDRLDIRPQGVWRVDGDRPVARAAAPLSKRVAKYVRRGFPSVACPRTTRYEGGELATPPALIEALVRIPGIVLTV